MGPSICHHAALQALAVSHALKQKHAIWEAVGSFFGGIKIATFVNNSSTTSRAASDAAPIPFLQEGSPQIELG